MNRLRPAGVTAWSWVSALGRAHSGETDAPLGLNFTATPLLSHESALGIPGYSGRYPFVLPELPEELRQRDSRCARLLYASLEPLRDQIAKLKERVGQDRIAIILGSSTGGIDATEHALRHERSKARLPENYRFSQVHPYDALLSVLASALDLEGPAYVVSTACSSGGKALASAQRLLHCGLADAAIVGGADALCEMTVRGFAGLGVLSPAPCRPFAANRAGISIGEGAALLVLEADSEAEVQLLGVGESSDAYHATAPHPEGIGAVMAMNSCLEIAGLSAGDVDYLNAHGTGTDKNDEMEAIAIHEVLGPGIGFSSTKNKTGHQLGTAGTTEAIFCVQAVQEGRLSRLLLDSLSESEPPDESLATQPRPPSPERRIDVALSNSFAFGGSNVTVAIGKRQTASPPVGCAAPVFVERVALFTPEYPNLDAWRTRAVSEPVLPPAKLLGARARGRASVLTRTFAELYEQLMGASAEGPKLPAVGIPTIYASCYGEMETTLKLLDQMDESPTLSPIRFQASVHNTASGRISLETKNRAFSTALAAGQETFSMALIEAQAWLACHGGEVLLLVADEELPTRLEPGLVAPTIGIGLRLRAEASPTSLTRVSPAAKRATAASLRPDDDRLKKYASSPPVWGLAFADALSGERGATVPVGPHFSVDIVSLSAAGIRPTHR